MGGDRSRTSSALALVVACLCVVAAGCANDAAAPPPSSTTTSTLAPNFGTTLPVFTTSAPLVPDTTLPAFTTSAPLAPGTHPPEAYAAAIAAGMTANVGATGGLTSTEADCVGSAWVELITPSRLEAAGIVPDSLADPAFPYSFVGLDLGTASAMIDALGGCGLDVRGLLLGLIGTTLSPAEVACAEPLFDEGLQRSLLANALVSGVPSDEDAGKLLMIAGACEIAVEPAPDASATPGSDPTAGPSTSVVPPP